MPMKFTDGNGLVSLSERMKSNNDVEFKIFQIQYEKIQGPQYKRICQDYATAVDLIFNDYWETLKSYTNEEGAVVLKRMLSDTDKPVDAKHLTVYGGEGGYLCAKFFKKMNMELRGSEDCSVDIAEVSDNAIVVLDTDVVLKMAPPVIERKRAALDVTVFQDPEPTMQRADGESMTTREVTSGDINWEELGQPILNFAPMSARELAIIQAIQVHYDLQKASLTEENELKSENVRISYATRITQLQTVIDQMTSESLMVEANVERQMNQLKTEATNELDNQSRKFEEVLKEERTSWQEQVNQLEQVKVDLEGRIRIGGDELVSLQNEIRDLKLADQQKNVLLVNLQLQLTGTKVELPETNPFSPQYKPPVRYNTSDQLPKPQVSQSHGLIDDDSSSMGHEASVHPAESQAEEVANHMISAAIANVKPVTISKYGIRVWCESQTTLIEHFAMVMVGLDVAKDSGVTSKKSLLSLLFQSLPQKYVYAREYVTESGDITKIMAELVEILVGDRNRLLADFMRIQRARSEPLLQYFTKLRRVYAYACNLDLEKQESDQQVCRLMVQKLQDSMESAHQAEFEKRLDEDMTEGTLTMKKISFSLIRVSKFIKKTQSSMNVIEQGDLRGAFGTSQVYVVSRGQLNCGTCGKRGHTTENCWSEIICGHCGVKGHPLDKCRLLNVVNGNGREPTTDGIQALSSNPQAQYSSSRRDRGCWHCGQPGHFRANCPTRAK